MQLLAAALHLSSLAGTDELGVWTGNRTHTVVTDPVWT